MSTPSLPAPDDAPLPEVPGLARPVALSTSACYPLGVPETFAIAQDLGYDAVEVMITGNPLSRTRTSCWTCSRSTSCPSPRSTPRPCC